MMTTNGTTNYYQPRIFIHAPADPDQTRVPVKQAVLDLLASEGFDVQEFGFSGLPKGDAWTFERSIEVMKQCDGACIIALKRFELLDGNYRVDLPSEYCHFEGALALSHHLQTLVIGEKGMDRRGVLGDQGGSARVDIDCSNLPASFKIKEISENPSFRRWVEKIRMRKDVFLGYCSKAKKTASFLKGYLEENGLSVHDWASDFVAGRSILEEIEKASKTCRCGLFLFTRDDPIRRGVSTIEAPRDNVILEAGYFARAISSKRVLIVREKRAKMPVDFGGLIYLTFDRKNKIEMVADEIVKSIYRQMNEDVRA